MRVYSEQKENEERKKEKRSFSLHSILIPLFSPTNIYNTQPRGTLRTQHYFPPRFHYCLSAEKEKDLY